MLKKFVFALAAALATITVLSSCGSASKPAAPSLNLDYQAVKLFNFSWTDVSGEASYKLLEDKDGSGDYEEMANIPANTSSYELEVFLPNKVNARYKLAVCNDVGCGESAPANVDVSQLERAVGYFKASNAEADDRFGFSLAISADGKTLAVGAKKEDSSATGVNGNQNDDLTTDSGAVYVFTRTDSGWTQQAYIKASNTGEEDQFGYSLAISADGKTLAVGALGEASNATGVNGNQGDDSAPYSGAVYIFTLTDSGWAQQAYIKASNAQERDLFGYSLALAADGNTLAVGAYGEDSSATGIDGNQNDNSVSSSGAVYVFVRNDNDWSQQAYIKASNTGSSDFFGRSVSLAADGDTLAVGASGEDSSSTGIDGDQNDNSALYSGAVYVFTRSGSNWSQQAYIKASNTGAADNFGYSLTLTADGDTLVVGAPWESSSATGINGDQNDDLMTDSGAVYVFLRDSSGNWTQQAYIKASNTGKDDRFGYSLTISADGDILVIGAENESSSATGIGGDQNDDSTSVSGAAYLFRRSSSGWIQQTYIKATNPGAGDWFSWPLAISGDGKTLAVAAQGEDSSASGIGGDQTNDSAENSGTVYIF